MAGCGVWASHAYDQPALDGYASIVIGLLLAVVAAVLAREAKGLLIGERADPMIVARIRTALEARPEIVGVNHVRTIHTGPETVFVAISAEFRRRPPRRGRRGSDRIDRRGVTRRYAATHLDLYPARETEGRRDRYAFLTCIIQQCRDEVASTNEYRFEKGRPAGTLPRHVVVSGPDYRAEYGPKLVGIAGHPVYPTLLPIPILCFWGALITDLAYVGTTNMLWLTFRPGSCSPG